MDRDNYLDIFRVLDIFHGLGGICVPAHSFRGWDSLGEDVRRIEGLDAMDTHSGRSSADENRKAMHAARIKNLPSIGGSDCPRKEQVERAFAEFTHPVHPVHESIEGI